MATYKRRLGDRKNARLIRSLNPYSKFTPYIMPKRNESNNYYEESFKINAVDDFLHGLRKEGYKGIGLMHFIIASYVRALAKYPGLNRYVAGRKVYAKNDIDVAMVVKRTMEIDGDETTIKVAFEPTDTLIEVYQKFSKEVDAIKNSPEDNNVEAILNVLASLPRFLLRFTITMLKVMDFMDWLPKSLLEASPFHASLMLTNVGSLGIRPVFHHLYDFGTLPIFVAFGAKRQAYELDAKGQVQTNKYVDIRFTLDDRINDGFYYASFLREFRRPFLHPELLLTPQEQINEDVK